MTTPSSNRCSGPPNTGRSSRTGASPTSTRPARGPRTSCTGTTTSTGTAASATAAQHSATPVATPPSWPLATSCISRLASATHAAGQRALGTGRPSRWSRSTPSATASSRHTRPARINSQWLLERGDNYLDSRRSSTWSSSCSFHLSSSHPSRPALRCASREVRNEAAVPNQGPHRLARGVRLRRRPSLAPELRRQASPSSGRRDSTCGGSEAQPT